MNFFRTILNYLKKHFGGQNAGTLASEAHSAQLYLNLATPALVFAIQQAGASDASGETQKVATEISNDLNTVSRILGDIASGQASGETATQQVVTGLNSLKANLGAVLTLAHVKNASTVNTIENTANAVITEVDTIIEEFVPSTAASTMAVAAATAH